MFRKSVAIEEVKKGFSFNEGCIVYQSNNEIVKYSLIDGKSLLRSKVEVDFQGIIQQESRVVGLSNTCYALLDANLHLRKEVPIENGVGDFNIYNRHFIVVTTGYDYTLFQPKQGIYDIMSNRVIWESDAGQNIRIMEDVAFTVAPKGVGKRDFANGEVSWVYGIDNKNLVPDLIGVTKSTVLFGLQGIDKLLALDIKTGTLKWEVVTFVKGLHVDKCRSLLHQMMVNYASYDLETGELKDNFRDSEYFQSVGIESQRSNYVLVGDHIVTTDWRKGTIGAFNTNTHKFDWIHHEKGVNFPAANPMRYCEPYLFVHDNQDTLHIFELK